MASRTAGTPISSPFASQGLAIGPGGHTAYVRALEAVYFIDPRTGAWTGYVEGLWASYNAAVAITPDGATGFVSDDVIDGQPEVIPFSTQTTKREASIRNVGPGPVAITRRRPRSPH